MSVQTSSILEVLNISTLAEINVSDLFQFIFENLESVADSKKMLAGLLLRVQAKAFEYAAELEKKDVPPQVIKDTGIFVEKELNVRRVMEF